MSALFELEADLMNYMILDWNFLYILLCRMIFENMIGTSFVEEIIFLGEGSFVAHDDTFSIKSFSSLFTF